MAIGVWTMKPLPPDETEIRVLDVVQDRQGRKGVVFRMRPLYPNDAETIHVITKDRDEIWFRPEELTVIGKAIQE